jgi:hypothetical protein
MNTLERIARILERARVAGGWLDEDVAKQVLAELGLDDDGKPEVAEADKAAAKERAETERHEHEFAVFMEKAMEARQRDDADTSHTSSNLERE